SRHMAGDVDSPAPAGDGPDPSAVLADVGKVVDIPADVDGGVHRQRENRPGGGGIRCCCAHREDAASSGMASARRTIGSTRLRSLSYPTVKAAGSSATVVGVNPTADAADARGHAAMPLDTRGSSTGPRPSWQE